LHELSKASNVGFEIDVVPLAPEAKKFAERHDLDPVELCFYGGEEYELVVTVKPKLWRKAQKAVEEAGGKLIKIGRTVEKKGIYLKVKDGTVPLEPRGWEHFRREK
ncbi:thiamine-phosphate kinase, partial [Candidatus Bathyarchaeota archaeon]